MRGGQTKRRLNTQLLRQLQATFARSQGAEQSDAGRASPFSRKRRPNCSTQRHQHGTKMTCEPRKPVQGHVMPPCAVAHRLREYLIRRQISALLAGGRALARKASGRTYPHGRLSLLSLCLGANLRRRCVIWQDQRNMPRSIRCRCRLLVS